MLHAADFSCLLITDDMSKPLLFHWEVSTARGAYYMPEKPGNIPAGKGESLGESRGDSLGGAFGQPVRHQGPPLPRASRPVRVSCGASCRVNHWVKY